MSIADHFPFDGQVALVTGASAGLGRRMAVLLAENGAAVAIAARRADRLGALSEEITDKGGKAFAVELDLVNVAAFPSAIDRIEGSLGSISILINNAGVALYQRAVGAVLTDFDQMMNVNVRGAYFLATEVGRRMIARGEGGSILNISSASGIKPLPGFSAYCISKAALIHMTRVLALEWAASQINVNAICPGHLRSEMTEELAASETGRKLRESLPRKRIGVPEDLDCMVLAMLSPANRFTTGAIVTVDDGISLS